MERQSGHNMYRVNMKNSKRMCSGFPELFERSSSDCES